MRQLIALFGLVPLLSCSNDPSAPSACLADLVELGWVGIPLLAVGLEVGLDRPIRYNSYTPRLVEDAVARATSGAP